MKTKELNTAILIAELDPKMRYIALVNPMYLFAKDWNNKKVQKLLKDIPTVMVHDVDKALKFVEVLPE